MAFYFRIVKVSENFRLIYSISLPISKTSFKLAK
jgi:hypothetical protein